jgi:hypothetical protein
MSPRFLAWEIGRSLREEIEEEEINGGGVLDM